MTTRPCATAWPTRSRALRIFADAEGRMNEALGEREVLVVSQFTLLRRHAQGQPPLLRRRGAARAGRAAVRALRRPPRRRPRRLRRDDGGRAGQRRPGDAHARACVAFRPPCHPKIASSPASPPSRRRTYCPTAAGRRRSRRSSSPPACASTAKARSSASPTRSTWYPDRTWHGRTFVPATARTANGLRALRLRQLRARRRRRGAQRLPRRRRLHGRDGGGQPGLADRPVRRGRRHLARRAGQGRRHDARVGRARSSTAAPW